MNIPSTSFEVEVKPKRETLDIPISYATATGIFAFAIIILYILVYIQSCRFHEKTKSPKTPDWMMGLSNSARLVHEQEHGKFSIAVKRYEFQYARKSDRRRVEESKSALRRIRRILGKMMEMEIDEHVIPDTTCIISIPMRNFESERRHAEFIPLHEADPESYFEYQMVGTERIQVTYYVVGGVNYIAGFCIYIKDPYQKGMFYSEKVIEKLFSKPNYWSKHNLEEETLNIIRRESELILVTKNRYGEVKHLIHKGDQKKLEPIEPLPSDIKEEIKMQSSNFKVQICHRSRNGLAFISEQDGQKFHVKWNREKRKMEYSECDYCNRPVEAPPPPYHSISFSGLDSFQSL